MSNNESEPEPEVTETNNESEPEQVTETSNNGSETELEATKVLLMGRQSVGKTSMHNIIFKANQHAQTKSLVSTWDVTPVEYKMIGNLKLSLWDCGGQAQFFEGFFDPTRKKIVFSGVKALVFVFAADRWDRLSEDRINFMESIKALKEFSPKAKFFIVISKIDLITTELELQSINRNYGNLGQTSAEEYGFTFDRRNDLLTTSYCDYSLWKAWAKIIRAILPSINDIDEALVGTCCALYNKDGVIFDNTTLLPIAEAHFLPDNSLKPRDVYDEFSETLVYESIIMIRKNSRVFSRVGIGGPDAPEDSFFAVKGEAQWFKPFGGNTTIFLRSVHDPGQDFEFPLECMDFFYEKLEERKMIFAAVLGVDYVPSVDMVEPEEEVPEEEVPADLLAQVNIT